MIQRGRPAGAPTASLERPRTGVSRTQENGPCPGAPGRGRTPARASPGRGQAPAARRGTRSAALLTVLAVVAAALAACSPPGQPGPRAPTYAELGRQALHTLEHGYYDGAGEWNVCVPHICGTGNVDWGVDSLTYALYFHWSLTHDRGVRPIMSALDGTAVNYSPAVHTSSDVPVWDTIADVREYQVTGDVEALAKAEAAFRFVADGGSRFALGACPAVDYQQPGGGGTKLKTLETGSNYIKAALLLYQVTRFPRLPAGRGDGVRGGPEVLPVPRRAALHRVRVRQRVGLHPGARPLLRLGQRQHDLGGSLPGPGHRRRVLPRPGGRHRPGGGPASGRCHRRLRRSAGRERRHRAAHRGDVRHGHRRAPGLRPLLAAGGGERRRVRHAPPAEPTAGSSAARRRGHR